MKIKNFYWPIRVIDKHIVTFQREKDEEKRNELYNEHLDKPFKKMAEYICHRYKWPYILETDENIQALVLGHLYFAIPHYDSKKGKSYSYMSLVAKNFLIQANRKAFEELKRVSIPLNEDCKDEDKIEIKPLIKEPSKNLDGFIDYLAKYLNDNFDNIFKKPNEKTIGRAFIELMNERNEISQSVFNKKQFLHEIRRRTGFKTQRLRTSLDIIRAYYDRIKAGFLNDEKVIPPDVKIYNYKMIWQAKRKYSFKKCKANQQLK